ncbi:hypothetical protein GCM10027563_23450 [Parasphingorhabdus pacifica]
MRRSGIARWQHGAALPTTPSNLALSNGAFVLKNTQAALRRVGKMGLPGFCTIAALSRRGGNPVNRDRTYWAIDSPGHYLPAFRRKPAYSGLRVVGS